MPPTIRRPRRDALVGRRERRSRERFGGVPGTWRGRSGDASAEDPHGLRRTQSTEGPELVRISLGPSESVPFAASSEWAFPRETFPNAWSPGSPPRAWPSRRVAAGAALLMIDLSAGVLALVVLALALVGSGVAAVLASKSKRGKSQRRLEIMRSVDGRLVRIGVISMRKPFVIEHTGVLRVNPAGDDEVLLEGTDKMKTTLSIPVARIRWLADPRTGQHFPW